MERSEIIGMLNAVGIFNSPLRRLTMTPEQKEALAAFQAVDWNAVCGNAALSSQLQAETVQRLRGLNVFWVSKAGEYEIDAHKRVQSVLKALSLQTTPMDF